MRRCACRRARPAAAGPAAPVEWAAREAPAGDLVAEVLAVRRLAEWAVRAVLVGREVRAALESLKAPVAAVAAAAAPHPGK